MSDGGGVVHADAALDLIVKPDFFPGVVLAAGELHAIHPQVRFHDAVAVGVLGENLRESYDTTWT